MGSSPITRSKNAAISCIWRFKGTDMALSVGQRWRYKNSIYHFIAEVIAVEPHVKCRVVHFEYGIYTLGQEREWTPIESDIADGWHYLAGQDKPV